MGRSIKILETENHLLKEEIFQLRAEIADLKKKTKKKDKRGRALTTGRFDTRERLVDNICWMYHNDRSIADASRNSEVSEATAGKIINKHYFEWKKDFEKSS